MAPLVATDSLVVVIPVLGTCLVSVITAIFAGLAKLKGNENARAIADNTAKTTQIHEEVRTMNELSIGQLGEAAETRRISEIPKEDQTSREKRHVDAAEERSTGA